MIFGGYEWAVLVGAMVLLLIVFGLAWQADREADRRRTEELRLALLDYVRWRQEDD